MNNKLRKIFKSSIFKSVFILTSGTAAAQLITVLISPIITRIYGPEQYGIFGTFTSIIAIVGPLAALTYPISIVLPRNENNAKKLVKLSTGITLIVTFVITILIVLFGQIILSVFDIYFLQPYLYLIPLVVLFSGLYQIMDQWIVRTKQFGVAARVTFIQAIVTHGGKLGVGLVNPSATVLVTIATLGIGLKALLLKIFSIKVGSESNPDCTEPDSSTRMLAKKYIDFPLFRAPEILLSTISQNLPILLLTTYFGPISVGYYAIGRNVLALPTSLIGNSVGNVFYPRMSEAAHNGENLSNIIKKATFYLGVIGIIPFGLVTIFGPWLFSFVFGAEWVIAGEYARWISLWTFFGFVNIPSVRALPVLNAQAFQLKYTIISLVIRAVSISLAYYLFDNDIIAISIFCISGVFINIILIYVTIRIANTFDINNNVSYEN